MKRTESIIVGIFIAFMLPLSLSIAGWWAASLIYLLRLYKMREAAIANAALIGLVFGVILVVSYLGTLKKRFYTAEIRLMAVVYLFWSFMSVVFLRGMPIGSLAAGMVAGLYAGRRAYHAGFGKEEYAVSSSKTGRFAAAVTAGLTLFIGVLSLRDPAAVENTALLTGLQKEYVTSAKLFGLAVGIAFVLAALQYWLTKAAAALAFAVESGKGEDREIQKEP